MFVLSPVGPVFDLETEKKFFCRVSDYALSDGGNRFYLVNTCMRSKRDIKMGRLCTPGGAVLGIVSGGVAFRFLNGETILDEKNAILGTFICSCGCLENPTRFQTIMVKIIWTF